MLSGHFWSDTYGPTWHLTSIGRLFAAPFGDRQVVLVIDMTNHSDCTQSPIVDNHLEGN